MLFDLMLTGAEMICLQGACMDGAELTLNQNESRSEVAISGLVEFSGEVDALT